MKRYAEADLPTAMGTFRVCVYRAEDDFEAQVSGAEHVALVHGDLAAAAAAGPVLVRVHSECLTGEAFHSLRCDCRQQLDRAMERVVAEGAGVVVYLRQEGRGIGLGNKVRAYALQERGVDTVDANLALGFAADLRSYEVAALILRDLGVTAVRIMTNNPAKIAGLERGGIAVAAQEPHWVGSSEHNSQYLEAKRSRLGHLHPERALAEAPAGAPGSDVILERRVRRSS
jgi:3,4-dihydroxy 2-butanone 4-phosphate synthase/GTP cyclohydrolase II